MARNGSGQFDLLVNSWNPATNGVLATAGDWQSLINDIAAALTQSVSKDGQTPLTGPLNAGNNPINNVTAGTGTGQALAFQQLFNQGTMADLASAATTDIGAQNTTFLRITGNTTITSFGSNFKGPRFLVFEGAVTLTNSSTLVLPGNANITTAAGDVLIAIPGATLGTADKWIVTSYQKANTVPGYSNIPGGFGFRNRIINGDMRIDQRNVGAATTVAGYCVDRWMTDDTFGAVYTQQQVTDAPSGFTNSLKITVTTAGTPTAGQWTFSRQIIEGNNIADLAWGTASAVPVTVSVWVKSSIAGTYSAFLINNAEDRSYVGTFTVNAANTWEQKSFTVPGDTTGTWLTNNGNGIRFGFDLGSGSNFQGTANAWNTGWKQRTSGTVNFCQTSGATFQITGVQLEAGTVASPFERRDYGRELMMCQRYYEKSYNSATAPGTVTGSAFRTHIQASSQYASIMASFCATKRATPTVVAYNPITGATGSIVADVTTISASVNVSESFVCLSANNVTTTANQFLSGHWTATAEL